MASFRITSQSFRAEHFFPKLLGVDVDLRPERIKSIVSRGRDGSLSLSAIFPNAVLNDFCWQSSFFLPPPNDRKNN